MAKLTNHFFALSPKRLLLAAIPLLLLMNLLILLLTESREPNPTPHSTTFNPTKPPHTITARTTQTHIVSGSAVTKWPPFMAPFLRLSMPVRLFAVSQLVMLVVAVAIFIWLLAGRESDPVVIDDDDDRDLDDDQKKVVLSWWDLGKRYPAVAVGVPVLVVVVCAILYSRRGLSGPPALPTTTAPLPTTTATAPAAPAVSKPPKPTEPAPTKPAPTPTVPSYLSKYADDFLPDDYPLEFLAFEEYSGSQERAVKQQPLPAGITGVRGLKNLGNTCFMNSVLQCLAHVGVHRGLPTGDPLIGTLAAIDSSDTSMLTPADMAAMLPHYVMDYQVGVQQDAADFAINAVANEAITRHFAHKMKETRTCLKCRKKSDRVEHGLITSVGLTGADGVQQLLAQHQEPQPSEWNCTRKSCQQIGNSTTQSNFYTMPNVLVVHLKRFERQTDGRLTKISATINADSRLTFGLVRYVLRAAVIHHGPSLHNGHYTACLVREDMPGLVMVADDQFVYAKDEEELINAYILFYTRL